MLNRLRIYIMNQFGFSKIEANGVIILIFVTFLVAVLPRIFFHLYTPVLPDESQGLAEWYAQNNQALIPKPTTTKETTLVEHQKFLFDPNTESIENLKKLGFSDRTVNSIHAYRKAGGSFKTKHDLKKIYNIDTVHVLSLYAFIDLPEKIERTEVIKSEPKNESDSVQTVALLPLNTAIAEDLVKISGIGPVLSKRIIDYRESLGGFYDMAQLNEVYNLSGELVQAIANQFYIDTTNLRKINLAEIQPDSLRKHPYLNYNQAKAIVNYHQVNGINGMGDLKKIKILPDSTIQKLIYYLDF